MIFGTALRQTALKAFARVNPGDVYIRHHHTGDRIRLHSFKHKGYWFYGKNREAKSIALCRKLIAPGDTVIEVGGHIGYLSLIFSALVGGSGRVFVFEPGTNNLPYIRTNLSRRSNVQLIEYAVSDKKGIVKFFLEDLTGQNNSLLSDYEVTTLNARHAGHKLKVSSVQVPCTTIDDFVSENSIAACSFVKIDVEGAELMVLSGMKTVLQTMRPVLMVEMTRESRVVIDLLTSSGYVLLGPTGNPLSDPSEAESANAFAIHGNDPRLHTVQN